MKKYVLLLVLAALVLLCGCTESEIACGVNAEHQAYLRWELSVDTAELELGEQVELLSWIRALAESMRLEHGYTVDHNALAATGQTVYLHAELLRQGSDDIEAMELLRGILTDPELSPFTAVEAEAIREDLGEGYRLRLRLEPDQLLETAGIEGFPKRTRERVEQWLDGATLRLRMTLPAQTLPDGETAELHDGLAEKSVTIPLRGNTEQSLITAVYIGGGDTAQLWWNGSARVSDSAEALEAQMQRESAGLEKSAEILKLCAVGFGVLALLLFVWGTVRAVKRRRAAQSLPQPAPPDVPAAPPVGIDPRIAPPIEENACDFPADPV